MSELTLTACDAEPIHIPGSVQPHGVMLVLDAGLRVQHWAGPAETLLGTAAGPELDVPALLGPDLAARAASLTQDRPGVSYLGLVHAAGNRLDASIFPSGNHLVIELEQAAPAPALAAQMLDMVEDAATTFERSASVQALCDRAATVFRRLTGFGRVMVYHFLDDGAGRVLAESRRDGLHSFLNHHFPATDIPQQARALYIRNLIRVIPDAGYHPAPLQPAWPGATPLDMSDSSLRSVSPIHIQYLHNMGVQASASISIIRDGALWGLIACHNETPLQIPYEMRAACRTLAATLARQIKAKEEAETFRGRLRLRGFEDDLVRALAQESAMDGALPTYLPDIVRMMDADGAALVDGAAVPSVVGNAPFPASLRGLSTWLRARLANLGTENPIFTTSNLETAYPPAAQFREHGSGLLAIPLASDEPTTLMLFRAEQIEVIEWAGHPHKDTSSPTSELTPRASFASWAQTVRGHARRWTTAETEAAARLRALLDDIRQGRRMKALNRQLTETLRDREKLLEQKDYLVGEVNHRVQNSLQLVASFLSLQGRTSASQELKDALNEAQRRLAAVALVHRRLYSGDQLKVVDAARYVEELCADAVASMGREWRHHLSLDLAPVPLSADRAVTTGLVLTELLININKYAYQGTPGPVEVSLREDREGFRLAVADRGTGKLSAGTGFGSRMIKAMVAQLGGDLTYEDNSPGLCATLTAPLEAR